VRPVIVCLCGSTRFGKAFQEANLRETLAGKIVLTVGCDFKSDGELGLDADTKTKLDELHKHKINLADEILVLNVDGYVGESTQSEIDHARELGKRIRWLEYPAQIKG
jgi:nitrogenase subunit NifH